MRAKTNKAPNPGAPNTLSENNPMQGAPWDLEWAAERAAGAMRYLADYCPASAGAAELHPRQDAAHAAAVEGDRDAYLDALRDYVRSGQEVERRARRRAA